MGQKLPFDSSGALIIEILFRKLEESEACSLALLSICREPKDKF